MKRLFAILFAILTINAFAQFDMGGGGNGTTIELNSSVKEVKAGESFTLAALITNEPTYWSYYNGSVGSEVPLSFSFETPEGVSIGLPRFRKPHIKQKNGKLAFVYKKETVVLFDVTVDESFGEESVKLKVNLLAQLCNEKGCLAPSDFEATLSIPVGDSTKLSTNDFAQLESNSSVITKDIRLEFSSTESEVTIKFITNLDLASVENLYFTDPSSIAAPVIAQEFKKIDNGFSLTLPRRSSFDELIEIPEILTGILFSKSGKIFGNDALIVTSTSDLEAASKQAAEKPTTPVSQGKHKDGFFANVQKFSKADKDKHKALYNADQKINYVTLDQAKELIKGGNLDATTSGGESQTIATAMFFAFIGGMILNLMPCVFPVLGLKVMGFAQMAGNEPRKIKLHGLVFTGGVIASMWVLAGAILSVKAALEKAGEGSIQWGAQMQNPIFVALIILLLFIMGLNMYGVFEIGTKLTSAGGELQNKKGYSGSFFSGVLTTLIATPCSGPFLGAAMSYTLGLPALEALMVFTVFALGISFPYVLLAFIPALINKLPRPGAWMEVMKKSMAFPLFATAIFFLGTFGHLTGVKGMYWLSMAMVTVSLALWAYGTWSLPYVKKVKRLIWGFGFPLVIATAAGFMTKHAMGLKGETKDGWHQGVVEHHLSKKVPVWVDYTAEW